MERAREHDGKAENLLLDIYGNARSVEFALDHMPCRRREAVVLLATGKLHMAVEVLVPVVKYYMSFMDNTRFDIVASPHLKPMLAPLKLLADALEQSRNAGDVLQAGRIRADVQETEAVLSGYWEGVLEEVRRELAEQRRAAAAAAAVETEGAEQTATPATKKNKAAKRKQQKWKAQQQKNVAEMAAAAAARGEEKQTDEQKQGEEQEQDQEEMEAIDQEAMATTAAALTGMALGKQKGQQAAEGDEDEGEEEEGGDDECPVCLEAIDRNDATNPGPPLLCGHLYHKHCLGFWMERCLSKSIEPTCPYCRSPLQELEDSP